MKYMGSKNRIAKELLPIILKDRKEGQWYVEPFVGGANMIDKVDGNRIGNDTNFYLIELLKALQEGWLPPKDISECVYKYIKNHKDEFEPCLVGYVGTQLTFGSTWFGTYRRDKVGKRNYSIEAYNNVFNQIRFLKGILFLNGDFLDIHIPKNSIIYCDPPYESVFGYGLQFDHDLFWEWCRLMTKMGHKVYISEYNAPDDFKCIWSKNINRVLNNSSDKTVKATEKLFIYCPQ